MGNFRVIVVTASGTSGHSDTSIQGFGNVIDQAPRQEQGALVRFLVLLEQLGEPLDDEDDDLPTYVCALKVSRDASATVNDASVERLIEALQ